MRGIEAVLNEERVGHPIGDRVVDVVAAEERIARGGEDLEDVAVQIEQRRVERAAAEVVDGDPLLGPLAEPVRERCGGRLVQDAKDLEPRDAPCDLRGRALQLVEVGRDGDDRPLDALAERGLGELARPLETNAPISGSVYSLPRATTSGPCPGPSFISNAKRLRAFSSSGLFHVRPRRRFTLAIVFFASIAAPRLGGVADEDVAVRVEADDARKEPPPLLVGQDVHPPVPDARDDGVRCAEVDSDDRHAGSGNITWAPLAERFRDIGTSGSGRDLGFRSRFRRQLRQGGVEPAMDGAREGPHPPVVAPT